MDIEFGKEIESIYLIQDKTVFDEIFLFKKIIIKTNQLIIIEPDAATDEIKMSIREPTEHDMEHTHTYNKLNGRKLIGLWRCTNDQGYLDQVIIGADVLRPTISIFCECGLLGVFSNNALDNNAFNINL